MATNGKRAKTAAAAWAAQSREDAAGAVAAIGEAQRELRRIEAEMNDELARIREAYEAAAEPHRAVVSSLTEGVRVWAEANRNALTQGGKVKTAALSTGELRWRLHPPSVRLTKPEAVIEALRNLGLTRFIRVKEEVDKEAILAEPDGVKGVKGIAINRPETFEVVPFEQELDRPRAAVTGEA